MNNTVLYAGDTSKIFISPTFEPIKDLSLNESVQLITRKLIKEFCETHNLIVPNFVLNILDLYQDYVHTKGNIESRGIIQLYTVYFTLQLISAYWSAIISIKSDLLSNLDKIIDSIISPKTIFKKNIQLTTQMRYDVIEKITEAYKSLESILVPNGNSNITVGIKYFLFNHPVNLNWKYYDTILYHSLILLTVIYNMIYTLKTVANFDKERQKTLQLYVYNKKQNIKHEKKIFPQLFMIYGFMIQHSSRQPYVKNIDVEKKMKAENAKYNVEKLNTNKQTNKQTNEQELYDQIENNMHGINHMNSKDKDIKTMGIYSILNVIFQLMYYHPFPYDVSQLKSVSLKTLNNHPIALANQQKQQQLKTMSKSDMSDVFNEYDREQFEVLGEIGQFFQTSASQLSGITSELGKSHSYKDFTGRTRHKLNKYATNLSLKALANVGSKDMYDEASFEFAQRDRSLRNYMSNQNRKSKQKINKTNLFS